jgi:hypothetical protein
VWYAMKTWAVRFKMFSMMVGYQEILPLGRGSRLLQPFANGVVELIIRVEIRWIGFWAVSEGCKKL